MARIRAACVGILFTAVAAASLQAQTRVSVAPRVGVDVPLRDIGAAAPAGGPWYLFLERPERAAALEVAADLTWPSSPFGARITVGAALPADVGGTFRCYPGLACPDVLLTSKAEVKALSAGAAATWAPRPQGALVRPWLLAGAGLRRGTFTWPDAAVLVVGGSASDTRVSLDAGAGLAVGRGRTAVHLELRHAWSPRGDGARDGAIAPAGRNDPDALASRARSTLVARFGVALRLR